jgi:hypothetical protein
VLALRAIITGSQVRKMRALIVGLTLFTVSMSSYGSDRLGDGNYLLGQCQELEKVDKGGDFDLAKFNYCFAVIKGVRDAVDVYSSDEKVPFYLRACPPTEMQLGQAARIVIKFLKENPDRLHEPDSHLAMSAYWGAYPCKFE